jgi:putative ABC transport system permease protein
MITKLAWKNIWHKPLTTILSVLLLMSSVAIITILLLVEKQFEEKYNSNLDGIDLVLGAQGSPLQLVLSSIYQVDDPTGNIAYDSVKVWMKHPYVKSAIPLAYGDNYRGFKIVGTTSDYITKYNAKITDGRGFKHNFEVVVGYEAAQKLGIKINDTFQGTHGSAEEGEVHEHGVYKVVGIIQKTGRVIDNLILSNIPSVWQMHAEHTHESTDANPEHGEEGHKHDESCNHHHQNELLKFNEDHSKDLDSNTPNMEITAVLVEFRNKMGVVLWPRLIAQNTKMQAASPVFQMNRLFELFGIGVKALTFLAMGIMFISGISIFIALYNTLKERKNEFALMRVNGATRFQLLGVVLLESLLLCFVGFIFGTILGRIGIVLLSSSSESDFKLGFNPFEILWKKEGLLLFVTLLIGFLAAAIPAIKAYKINISKTLANV